MKLSTEKLPTLIAALDDPKVSVIWNACRELAKYAEAANDALPKLTKLLAAHDQTTALWARFAIAKVTGDTETHLSYFVEALGDKQRIWAGMASTAIAGFGAAANSAVPALIGELRDEKPDNRWAAAWALAQIGEAAGAAVPALAAALQTDSDEKVRWYAAFALSEIGEDAASAMPALIGALNDSDDDVRGYAIRALGRIGGAAHPALPLLEALRHDDNPTVRGEVEIAIALLPAESRALKDTAD